MKLTPLILVNLLLLGSFGCNTLTKVPGDTTESHSEVTEISIDRVRAMLSKQCTVQELERCLGEPRFKTTGNLGHIAYLLPRKDLSFDCMGNFVISARYDKVEITAIHPKIHKVRLQMEETLPVTPGQRTLTLPGIYALDNECFSTAADLLKKLTNLPKGSMAILGSGCTGQNPSEKFVEEMKKACERNGITLIVLLGRLNRHRLNKEPLNLSG